MEAAKHNKDCTSEESATRIARALKRDKVPPDQHSTLCTVACRMQLTLGLVLDGCV